ncbi:SPOR domain-containing protein [Alcanivorax jadensis]|uniref:SPOR domain-containing protein n=1 Tax=Alcanivorax jadensis TaxID=64988 RepID=UPI0023547754|nr:SPOR domain-containing protein [Alcanivorax jadensis]
MDKRTRQRIIGIVLLLLLAAVLAPFVFRSPEQIRNALDMQIPDQPEMTAVNVEPVVSEEMESAAAERIQSEREAVKEAAQEQLWAETDSAGESDADDREDSQAAPVIDDAPVPPPVKPDDSPVLAGFVVQVGSYSSADNAAGVVEKLKAAGYRAYSETDSHHGKVVHRVMVGPEIHKKDAERTRQQLADDSRFGFKGLVRIYAP